MKHGLTGKAILVTAVALFTTLPDTIQAARWGPDGHTGATYGVALGKFGISPDVAKVMALGSVAPDYFDFDEPTAHAQTPNPPIEGDKVSLKERVYDRFQEDSLRASNKWRRFYMDGAVSAMQQGNRERAAFLLGYAMHNSQDFSPHRGKTNIAHAYLDSIDNSPDKIKGRLEDTRLLTAGDIAEFRHRVGKRNWRLFKGESVRDPGSTYPETPSPLSTMASGLSNWQPETGVIAPREMDAAWKNLFNNVLAKALALKGYSIDDRNRLQETLRVRTQNFLHGMFQRQQAMLQLLDIPRKPGDPVMPPKKNMEHLIIIFIQMYEFKFIQPARFKRLSRADQKMLLNSIWLDLVKRDYQEMQSRRLAAISGLTRVLEEDAQALSKMRQQTRSNLRWIEIERERIRRLQEAWQHNRSVAFSLPPSIDARPRLPVATPSPGPTSPSTGTYGGGDDDDTDYQNDGEDGGYVSPALDRIQIPDMPILRGLQGLNMGIGGFD